MVNVGKYAIHGASGIVWIPCFPTRNPCQPCEEFGVLPLIESLAGIQAFSHRKRIPFQKRAGGGGGL